MARILFTWELGGGMGHVAPYLPLAQGLRDKGHEVAFVLRDLQFAETTLGKYDLPYYQAPVVLQTVRNRIPTPHIFPQILHNVGYGNVELLTGLVKAWRELFDTYCPDLILYDHSPTALLASRDMECKKAVIGPGFFIPPDIKSLPLLREVPKPDGARLASDDARILANINQVLDRLGSQKIDRVSQLYDIDNKLLMTFREMDTYHKVRPQQGLNYWGIGRSGLGSEAVWPEGKDKRIFAYLKPFKTLPALLQHLQKLNTPVIIYAPELSDEIKQKFASQSLCFSSLPVNLDQVASSCDIAITNGNHTTTATFLLAGKPQLLLPLTLEQAISAHNVEQIGAGLKSALLQPEDMTTKLQVLLDNPRCRLAAEAFAKQYADFDADAMEKKLIEHVDSLL